MDYNFMILDFRNQGFIS